MKRHAHLVRIFGVLLLGGTLLIQCNKKKDEPTGPESTVPENFARKVLIEEVTGEWCAACPGGATKLQQIKQSYPGKVTIISVHQGDPFEHTDYYRMLSTWQASYSGDNTIYFPSAAFDRRLWNQGKILLLSKSDWDGALSDRLSVTTDAGLYIEANLAEGKIYANIYAATKADYNNIRLTVCLIEDNIPESSPGAQENGGGDYIHHDVLRATFTPVEGEVISLHPGNVLKKTYTLPVKSEYKTENLYVIAFISHDDAANKNHVVINAQEAKVGEESGWN